MIPNDVVFIDVSQGSDEWLELRNKYITSTDAAIIHQTNKRKSPLTLWRQKLELEERDFVNAKMREGSQMEAEARDWYNKKHNTNFEPLCIMNKKYPWMFTSLDGYDKSTGDILEIKCGAATYDKISQGSMPLDYIDQAQHHICLSDKPKCHYLAYRPDKKPIDFFVERDQSLIDTLTELEKDFYDYLIKQIPPPSTEKEYVELKDDSAIQKGLRWAIAKENAVKYIDEERQAKAELLEETDDGNCIILGAGVKIQRIVKAGNIDYKKLLNDLKITDEVIEKYRKNEVSYQLPSILKEIEA